MQESISLDPIIGYEDIDIEVKCEVGKVSLSLDKLLGLRVGDKLPIEHWPQTVKLIAGNNCIAEGFLVEVNGMLGVKITNRFKGMRS